LSTTIRVDRAFMLRLADWLAVAIAVALPWSTTATAICIVLWLIALLPTLDAASVRRELATAAGGLPVLLWCLGVTGMLWANVSWGERLQGLDGFHRLLVIPLLLAQFRRSGHGSRVLSGFLISEGLVLAVSFALVLTPGLISRGTVTVDGVPVHDNIFQDSAFLICAFAALGIALDQWRKRRRTPALAFIVFAALFIANFAFVEISRIALLVAPVLAVLLGWRLARWKGIAVICVVCAVIAGGFWFGSQSLRSRLHESIVEFSEYRATNKATSVGSHLAFLKESATIIESAPIIGHGTGSIAEEFRRIAAGGTGAAAVASVNPHNQTFAVGIQLGIVGMLVLWSMWIAHWLLFRGESLAAWIGMVVVAENIVSSIVHTHLFDFAHGWLYVFGVGVLGGMVQRQRAEPAA
jgi:hypothetical protein